MGQVGHKVSSKQTRYHPQSILYSTISSYFFSALFQNRTKSQQITKKKTFQEEQLTIKRGDLYKTQQASTRNARRPNAQTIWEEHQLYTRVGFEIFRNLVFAI
jgi:hypothetical protein